MHSHRAATLFGRSWAYGGVAVYQLIEEAEMIGSLPFARLEVVVADRRIAGRLEDLSRIELIGSAGLI